MIEARSAVADELEALSTIPADDGGEFAGQLRSMLADGTTMLDWVFVGLVDSRPVARLAFAADQPPAGPPEELYLFGLALDWHIDGARQAALRALTDGLAVVGTLGPPVDARVNPEVHPDHELRRALLQQAGFGLFQEKVGHYWRAEEYADPPPASRLTFRSLGEIGEEEFRSVLARGPADTLDRNDRYYYELTGPDGWARVMMGYLQPDDGSSWKIGYNDSGQPAGYTMLSTFDEEATGTITHIAVLPEHRGKGYINDLLAETTADARERGFRAVLSDVDVLNEPMRAAFERAGHRAGVRPWHIWHYRHPPP